MAMTFDATLKDMGRDNPLGFLAAFDKPPSVSVKLLNVDLSTVTTTADLVLGLGEPLEEIIHLEFQSECSRLEARGRPDVPLAGLLFAHKSTCRRIPSSFCCAPRRPTPT